jgi:hypothetical protein
LLRCRRPTPPWPVNQQSVADPPKLAKDALEPTLEAPARHSAIAVELDQDLEARLPEPVEIAAHSVVSEALTNSTKHGHALVIRVQVRARQPPATCGRVSAVVTLAAVSAIVMRHPRRAPGWLDALGLLQHRHHHVSAGKA